MESVSIDISSILTIVVSIGILMIAFASFINFNLNKRIDDFKESFKDLFQSEIGSIRSEMKSEIGSIRSEMRSGQESLKELLEVKLELVHETLNNHIKSEIKANRDEIKALDQKMDKGFNEIKELIKRSKD